LSTNGDCSSSVLPPLFTKEVDGVFPPVFAGVQLCCGLPCSVNSYKNYEFTSSLTIGRWKVALFTCDHTAGMVESEIFEVIE